KEDNQILKFTNKGKFLMQIGHAGKNRGSNDTENLGGPAGLFVYPKTNELFVADGYFNHRVIVFDADTGAYKRHWGAYGKKPDDDHEFIYGVDGSNQAIRVLNRQTLEIISSIGAQAGHNAREFFHIHSVAIDSKGNLFLGEVNNGQRYYRYAFKGMVK